MTKLSRKSLARRAHTLAAMLAIASIASDLQASSLLVIDGRIYTGHKDKPWAEAMVVTDGVITAVGSQQAARSKAAKDAQVIELGGRTVIPGLIDSHLHPLYGSMALYGLNLSQTKQSVWPDEEQEIVSRLRDYAAKHPDDKVLLGRANFDDEPANAPHRELLDRAVSDRPVVIHNVSEHALWLNSRALELAGFTAQRLTDPAEEWGVVRGSDGHPTGVLREAAMRRVHDMVLQHLPAKQLEQMIRNGLHFLNSHGITAAVGATGSLPELKLYESLRDRDELTVRLRVSFGTVGVPHRLTPQFFEELATARQRYHDQWLSANLVKFFGVLHAEDSVYSPQAFGELVTELDKRGYQVMTHALTPQDIHSVLNAYETAIAKNKPRDRRLRLEHAYLIDQNDIKRFGKLGIVASIQPTICCTPLPPGLPPPNPVRSLLDSGAVVAFGSDWPVIFPPDPMMAISQAVVRNVWQGRQPVGAGQAGNQLTGDVNTPAERITVDEAVNAYTLGGAYATFNEQQLGSLEVGKLADFVVLSQNIFAVPAEEIARTHVMKTFVGGKLVFDNSKQ